MNRTKITYYPQGRPTYKDYMFLASMIKMRAKSMLTYERLEQMLSTGNADTAARLLAESGWPDFRGLTNAEIDIALNDRRTQLFEDISRVISEDTVMDVMRLRYDYHNAKAIIKAEAMDVSTDGMLSEVGRVSPKELLDAYHDSDYRAIPSALGKAMEEAKAVLAKTRNPQLADCVLDRACYLEMGGMCEEVEPNVEHESPLLDPEAQDPFMVRYRALLIDCANLRTCVRCLRMGKNHEFMREVLIPGGNVSPACLMRVAAGDGLPSAFLAGPLYDAAVLGASAIKGGPMTKFEKECEDGVMRYLANLRLMYFGPELTVWYLTAEETNITDVRMIINGLRAGADPKHLRERLRNTYV